ncbi:MAG: hypothetical protein EOP38_00430 [Rubrivivax sp.]|nr:MAG: hypothetical protein EOP38_00430 [Rubrivivax sp.]
MSVINRMLQDLQDRKAGLTGAPSLVMAPSASTPARHRLAVLLAGGGALLAAVVYSPWPMVGQASASHGPKPVALGAAAPASAVLAAIQPKPPLAQAESLAKALPKAPSTIVVKPLALPAPLPAQAAASAPSTLPASAADVGSVDKRVLAETPRQRAQTAYRQSVDMASTGHTRQAVDLALDALKADPSYSEARQLAVSLMYEQQRVAEAEALAREGLAMSRQQGQLAYLLARMLSDRGSNQAAIDLLDQQLTLGAEGHGLRGGILSQAGDFKRASLDYQSAAMLQPENSLWWFGLGVALEALGQPAEARRVYAKAQSLGMDRPDLTAFIDQKLRTLN